MAKKRTAKQKAIVQALESGGNIKDEVKAAAELEEVPEGPRTYMGLPGTTIVGIGNFPMTVEDPEIQKKIENSRSFKRGHVWVEQMTKEQSDAVELALENLSFGQLRKLAVALGHREIHRLTKVQLLEICTRDGASLL